MKNTIYILLCLILFSCASKEQENTENAPEKPLLSLEKQHESLEDIQLNFKKDVAEWQELKSLHSFLERFTKTSPNEALSNALELRDLVKSLKDSVKPVIFDVPSFNARVNVLNTETLRLADLTFIPAITAEEVNLQVDKTLGAFSAVNSKINTILSKKRFEKEVEIDFDFIGIDSTQIDTISRNSITKRLKENTTEKEELRNLNLEKKRRERAKIEKNK
ncbi:hypothetical protein [Polaribacter sp.]|uniref:hypothetical protein n=1 Tax=Polaribacter sp. TaxID=1920175 RepID=UPI003EF26E52